MFGGFAVNAAMNGKKKYFIEYDISLALIVKRMTDSVHSNQVICLYYELHGISSALFEHCFSFIKREGANLIKFNTRFYRRSEILFCINDCLEKTETPVQRSFSKKQSCRTAALLCVSSP